MISILPDKFTGAGWNFIFSSIFFLISCNIWRMPFGGCLFSLVDSLGNSRSSIKYLQSSILTLHPKKSLKIQEITHMISPPLFPAT